MMTMTQTRPPQTPTQRARFLLMALGLDPENPALMEVALDGLAVERKRVVEQIKGRAMEKKSWRIRTGYLMDILDEVGRDTACTGWGTG